MPTFQIASDIHLHSLDDLSDDFYQATSSTLVLVGDICESTRLLNFLPIFKRMSETWETVLYVLGNHEFYKGFLNDVATYNKDTLKQFSNIFILDNETKKVGDITFIGSTLWSDMNGEDPLSMLVCRSEISDYHYIKIREYIDNSSQCNYRKIRPKDTVNLFKKNFDFLKNQIEQNANEENLVVITHHAPSVQSAGVKFRTTPTNGAFTSNLDNFVADSPVKAWVHGHCHDESHYLINECQVICHPMGYYNELYNSPNDYRPLTVSIGEINA